MITSFMTARDLWQAFEKEQDRLEAWFTHREREMRKNLCRKVTLRDRIYRKCFLWHGENLDYLVVVKVFGNKSAYEPFVIERADKVRYIMLVSRSDAGGYTMIAPSAHFLHRYEERLLKPSEPMDIKSVLTAYSRDDHSLVRLRKANNAYVYASRNGIVLANLNPQRDIMSLDTFVSLDMLKESQRKAHDMVMKAIEDGAEAHLYSWKNKDAIKDYVECLSYVHADIEAMANDIYASYFDD